MNLFLLLSTLILIVIILFLPRRWAVIGVVAGVCYVTQTKLFEVSGIDITPIRLIIIIGFIRVFMVRREFSLSELNNIDKSLLIFSSVYLLIFTLRNSLHPSTHSNLTYRIGQFFDSMMVYFIFRGLLKDFASVKQFLKDLVFLIVPFTAFIILESITGKNLFSIMGGVPETPLIRDGYYRSQASFRHAITAGSFGATLAPFFIGLYFFKTERLRALFGFALCILITVASHSSGPLMALIAGVSAWILWFLRTRMRTVLWVMLTMVVMLAIIMKAPVWFIFDRISGVIGGHGWHRANLIDKFISNFREWWLMGMPLEKTYDWAATKLPWGAMDVTNWYVAVGINGGLLSLILFVWLLKKNYQLLGRAIRKSRLEAEYGIQKEALLWGLGSALFSHMVNITSVSYFDQIWVVWYLVLSVISGFSYYFLGNNYPLRSRIVPAENKVSFSNH